jgi:hypothetical protein
LNPSGGDPPQKPGTDKAGREFEKTKREITDLEVDVRLERLRNNRIRELEKDYRKNEIDNPINPWEYLPLVGPIFDAIDDARDAHEGVTDWVAPAEKAYKDARETTREGVREQLARERMMEREARAWRELLEKTGLGK